LLEEADDDNKLNLTNDFITEILGAKESTKKKRILIVYVKIQFLYFEILIGVI